MSVMPMNFDAVLIGFRHPKTLPVFDTSGVYVDGAWNETEPAPRDKPIRAVVLAMKTVDLDFYKEAYSTDSGISLHTKAELYWVDVNNTPQGQQPRQSYVEYQDYRFRVVGSGLMLGNTNFNIYHCVRYIR